MSLPKSAVDDSLRWIRVIRALAEIFGIGVYCLIVGLLFHFEFYSWAIGLALAGIISELRDARNAKEEKAEK